MSALPLKTQAWHLRGNSETGFHKNSTPKAVFNSFHLRLAETDEQHETVEIEF